MNREKIIAALVAEFRKLYPHYQEQLFKEALKHIASDTNLLAFTIHLGIDTDTVLKRQCQEDPECVLENEHDMFCEFDTSKAVRS